ncbi:MAG: TetR/AcrR family transcriptional regulator [Bacteroidetes bacterium]|jgi:AcrR family transcriptional regulator|nr:TetR/AcrR family transcriptional regulator [Bacteroidota bacterium]MDF1867575.1 TetR/AcrR family transcriptional regulator [Saprospiraceae bacterium]
MELKQQILFKAMEMFMRYGIKSITMDDLSRKLGISKKTLYRFVDNKGDLINKIFEIETAKEKEMVTKITNESKDAIDEILGIAKLVIQQLREYSPTLIYDLQKYYRESWMKIEAYHSEYVYGIIKTNLERGIKEGYYRENLNADIIAKLYVEQTLSVVNEDTFPLKEYNREKLYKAFINYHIHGIASPSGIKLLEQYHYEE